MWAALSLSSFSGNNQEIPQSYLDVISFLKERGADINARGKDGETTLMIVSAFNADRSQVINKLIDLGFSTDAKDNFGDTAIMYAIRNNPNSNTLLAHYDNVEEALGTVQHEENIQLAGNLADNQ